MIMIRVCMRVRVSVMRSGE